MARRSSACASEDFGEMRASRRRLAGLADQLRRAGAVLHARRSSLYHVHGERGEDPTEPPCERRLSLSGGQPRAAHPAAAATTSTRLGLRPFHVPLGIMLDEKNPQQEPVHPLRDVRRVSRAW